MVSQIKLYNSESHVLALKGKFVTAVAELTLKMILLLLHFNLTILDLRHRIISIVFIKEYKKLFKYNLYFMIGKNCANNN